ncbi:hypothetical protein BTUL_0113g00340 [Botrytis tulipae]|uniref:Aminoglycoside phosphotransferase domain-containing protein n=1 Tax=Botrytis tulipae TaxID=87230 RepID=A0A4Z1EFT1_9HELO|nr:hypothetical protein BTUL_0113g00340 [Botrytis tulipae]
MTTIDSLEEESPWLESQWYPPLDKIKRYWWDCHKLNGAYSYEENEAKWRIQNGSWPMSEGIKEIDDDPDAWLICNLILRRSQGRSPSADWYDEKDDSSYHITDAPMPPPKATYHKHSTRRFRAGGDTPLVGLLDSRTWLTNSTAWSIGYGGVLKMAFIVLQHDITHQSKTLNWLQGKLPSSRFQIPKVIRYEVQMKRHITFESQLYGLNFEQAWPLLSAQQRENVVTAVKDFCFELSKIKGERIESIEGKGLFDQYLPTQFEEGKSPYDPAGIQASWAATGLESALSEFCFSHNCLWAHHIILIDYPNAGIADLRVPTIGIVSWGMAGFVPKAWVRTKFVVDEHYDLATIQRLNVKLDTGVRYNEVHLWRWSVFRGLGKLPYNMPEVRLKYWKANPQFALAMGQEFIDGRGSFMHIRGEDAEAFLEQEAREQEEYNRNRPHRG